MLTDKARAFLTLHCPQIDPADLSKAEVGKIEKAVAATDMSSARAIKKCVAAVEKTSGAASVNKSLVKKAADRFMNAVNSAVLGKAADEDEEDLEDLDEEELPPEDEDEEDLPPEELDEEPGAEDTSDIDFDLDYYEGEEGEGDEADLDIEGAEGDEFAEGEPGEEDLSDEEIDAALDAASEEMAEDLEEGEDDEDEDEEEEFLGKSILDEALLGGDDDVAFVDGDELLDQVAVIVGKTMQKSLKPIAERIDEIEQAHEQVEKSVAAMGKQTAEASPWAILQHEFDSGEKSAGDVDRDTVIDVTQTALTKSLAGLTNSEAATIQKAAGTEDFAQHEDRFEEVLEAVNAASPE